MSSGTPSEEFQLSLSDAESFTDVQAMSSPRTSAQDTPSLAPEATHDIPAALPTQSKHPKYYFDDGSVLFLVGGLSYRVHRYLFARDSPYWADLLARGSESDTFDLADKDTSDFDAFLDVLYSTCYRSPQISTAHEWSAVLRLATEWSFADIRALAVERLEPLASPIEKLILSYSQDIPGWRPAAYTSLCARERPLDAMEVAALQADDVALVMSVRETLLREGIALGASKVSERVAALVMDAVETEAAPVEATLEAESASASPPPPSPTDAEDSATFTAAPTTSLDFRVDISGLLDVLGEQTFSEVATEITRWINSGDSGHGHTVLEYTFDAILDRVARGDNGTVHAELCVWFTRELPKHAPAFATQEAQHDRETTSIRKRLLSHLLAKMEVVRSLLGSAASAATVHDANITSFISKLTNDGLIAVTDLCELVETSTPNASDRDGKERQVQMFCGLLLVAAPLLRQSLVRAGREGIRRRVDSYLSAVRSAQAGQLCYSRSHELARDALLRIMPHMG